MTVKELIEKLQTADQQLEVIIISYEGFAGPINKIRLDGDLEKHGVIKVLLSS